VHIRTVYNRYYYGYAVREKNEYLISNTGDLLFISVRLIYSLLHPEQHTENTCLHPSQYSYFLCNLFPSVIWLFSIGLHCPTAVLVVQLNIHKLQKQWLNMYKLSSCVILNCVSGISIIYITNKSLCGLPREGLLVHMQRAHYTIFARNFN